MAVGLHFPLFQLLDSYVIIIIIIIISHKLTFQGSADGNILPLHFVWKTRESQTAKIKINGVISRSHIKNGCKNLLP